MSIFNSFIKCKLHLTKLAWSSCERWHNP